jgi:hypothetical protein
MGKEQATAKQVAQWMAKQLAGGDYLYQETVVYQIAEKFGRKFTYNNQNGNLAIRKEVLAAFLKLSKDSVVWFREDHCWRKRRSGDRKGRQQD